jgi:hypothetical protein
MVGLMDVQGYSSGYTLVINTHAGAVPLQTHATDLPQVSRCLGRCSRGVLGSPTNELRRPSNIDPSSKNHVTAFQRARNACCTYDQREQPPK